MPKINFLFDAWRKEDKDAQIMVAQKRIIGLLFMFSFICLMGWITSPSRMTVYIPPDISNGATLKANEIPNPLAYSFAYQVWQEINYWPQEGNADYANTLRVYAPYLTPPFKESLLRDYDDLKNAGQLQRQRFLQGMTGGAYEASNVKKLSENTWEVDLTMRLTEYKNNQPVKDIQMLYPLKVVRMNVSPSHNPYGLALAGFASPPVRLKTYR